MSYVTDQPIKFVDFFFTLIQISLLEVTIETRPR
jgi:hypothetical protein